MTKITKKALIIVDVQIDFCEGGNLAIEGGNKLANKILNMDMSKYNYILATRDYHINPKNHFSESPDYTNTWPKHCVKNTIGAELHPDIQKIKLNAIFDKGLYTAAYSGFEGSNNDIILSQWLQNHQITNIDIVGIALDYCVKQTALDGVKLKFNTNILTNYTIAIHEDKIKDELNNLIKHGVNIISQ